VKIFRAGFGIAVAVILVASARAEQTLLKAYMPADSDGSRVVLVIDWSQAKAHAPTSEWVMLRKRPDGLPTVPDTLAMLPVDSSRFVVEGLDPAVAYHFFASFKAKDSVTVQFGSVPAVVHLGPVHSRPHP